METNPPALAFKDRSTGLTVFGILTILGGVFCVLMILFVILGQTLPAERPDVAQNRQIIPLVAIIYGPLAITLVWLGIGSIKARRWARAILLVLSWTDLIVGLFAIGTLAILTPQFVEAMKPTSTAGRSLDAIQLVVLIVIGAIFLILFVGLPLTWALFYGSKNVKATCEVRDPTIRWTDRCPLPVLAISLWPAFGALSNLIMPISYRGVFPFFGHFLTGFVGGTVYILIAIAWAYSSYATFKLDQRGWWTIFITLSLFSISAAITYSARDSSEMYRLVGYSDQQIEQVQKFRLFTGKYMAWSSLIYTVPLLGYLLYVRRFFRTAAADSVSEARVS